MRLLEIIIALCLFGKSLQMVKFFQEDKPPDNQFNCVDTALEIYYEKYRDLWIFSANPKIRHLEAMQKFPIRIISRWDSLRKEFSLNKGATVIFLEGNIDRDLHELKLLQGISIVQSIFIVCVEDVVCNSYMYMKIITEVVNSIRMHYATINEQGSIEVYEYTKTAEGSCGVPQFVRLGLCSDESIAEKIFQKILNFHQCPMRVVTWHCPPYSMQCLDDKTKDVCGISASVMHMILKKINATLGLLMVETSTDVRRYVANKDADLGFGELDNRVFEGVLYTKWYAIVQATIFAPRSVWTLEQSFGNIMQPLEKEVWLGIGVVIVTIFILPRLVPYFQKIPALQVFGIIFGIGVPRVPRGLSNRIYFISLMLFGFIYTQAYLANLTRALVIPHERMIETLADLENSNLQITGVESMKNRFEANYPRIHKGFQVINETTYYHNRIKQLRGEIKSAYYAEDIQPNFKLWQNVEPLKERLNWYLLTFVVPNTSAIRESSRVILPEVQDLGLLKPHISLIIPGFQVPKHNITSPEKLTVLGFTELKGIFRLLIMGLCISFIVFLIEIIIAFIKKKKTPNRRNRIHPGLPRRRLCADDIIVLPPARQLFRSRRYID